MRDSVEDDGQSGRPKDATADENDKVVHTLVMCDNRRNLQRIASEVGISFGAVQLILTDILGMPKVSATWVPRMLTDDQKRTWLNISRYFLSLYEDNLSDFIKQVVIKERHGFTTLTQSQKCSAKNGNILAHPLLRNLREIIWQGR